MSEKSTPADDDDLQIKDRLIKLEVETEIKEEPLDAKKPIIIRHKIAATIMIFVPIIIAATLLLLAWLFGLFNPAFEDAALRKLARIEFVYYIGYFVLSYYMVYIMMFLIYDAIEETHKVTEITKAQHKKYMALFFGPLPIIIIIGVGLVLAIYDYNAFGLTVYNPDSDWYEGWVQDTGIKDGPIEDDYYVNNNMAFLHLLIWNLNQFISAAFFWYSLAFLIYSFNITKKFEYRNNPHIVKQLNLTKHMSDAYLKIGFPMVPALTLKFIAQIWLAVWWNDTIIMFVILVTMCLNFFLPVMFISKDVQKEAKLEDKRIKTRSILALVELIEKDLAGDYINLKKAIMALLYGAYMDVVQEQKKDGSAKNKKMITSVTGPVASYGAKNATKFINL
ncbi:MAG: hypothetical protein ACTSRA_07175 [Promethearchaeota archaeon]